MGSLGKSLALVLVALFSISLVNVPFSTAQASALWSVQTIDVNGAGYSTGIFCPIVVDSNDNPHIAYTDVSYPEGYSPSPTSYVMYASWNGSSWITQTVTKGEALDLVLDTNGNPHILYSIPRESLMYAYWTGVNWSIQTVNEKSSFGALALDSSGNPHIAYTNGTSVLYASLLGANWTIQIVDKDENIHAQLSLALDSNNKPYIFYKGNDLKLATWQSSKWSIQTIATSIGFGNMVLDSKGYPHLIYEIKNTVFDEKNNNTIVYASWNGTDWDMQTAVLSAHFTSDLSEGIGAFLALDSLGYPHISYIIGGDLFPELMYASWTGRSWDIQTVPTNSGASGVYGPISCYLILDDRRTPHISYYNDITEVRFRDVMYSTTNDTTPIFTVTPTILPTKAEGFVGQNMILLLVIVAVLATAIATLLLLFARHRKTTNQA